MKNVSERLNTGGREKAMKSAALGRFFSVHLNAIKKRGHPRAISMYITKPLTARTWSNGITKAREIVSDKAPGGKRPEVYRVYIEDRFSTGNTVSRDFARLSTRAV